MNAEASSSRVAWFVARRDIYFGALAARSKQSVIYNPATRALLFRKDSWGGKMSDQPKTIVPGDDEPNRSFERQKAIFEQDCQEFRSLNSFLWQIPIIVATLTGGLWFGVTKVGDDRFIKASLFLLAAVVNFTFIVVLWRLRYGVMEVLLDRMHNYQGRPRHRKGRYTVILMFTIILLLSGLISLIAFKPDAHYFWARVLETFAR